MRDTLNAPWLLTNRQFQWTDNGNSQLPLAELGKPSPNIDLLRTTGSKGENVNKHTLFDLHLWPMTLTYNPRLAKVKVDPHAKNQCQMSKRIISPAMWSIKMAAAPSWIVKYAKFDCWRCLEGPDASLYQISSKLVNQLRRYRFLIFQDGGRRPSWICGTHFRTIH